MTDNSTNFNSLQERNNQTLSDIQQLQTQEMDIYKSLDNATLTSDQKQKLIDQINQVSQMRINLYSNLNDMYTSYTQNATTSNDTLNQQLVAVNIIEKELNEAKLKLNLLEDEKYNKLRLVEINTYYSKKYNAHSQIMKTIVFICIPLLILVVLRSKGILPGNIAGVLIAIIIIIGVFSIGSQLIDLMNRDNMNFDEYNWYFDPNNAPTDNTGETNPVDPWAKQSALCVGSECCYEGSTYDASSNTCLPNDIYNQNQATATATTTDTASTTTTTDVTTESMANIGNTLGKYAYHVKKPVVTL